MREVLVSGAVMDKVAELKAYLVGQLKLSPDGANKRIDRIDSFLVSLANEAGYPLCRFKKWRVVGYRCAVFEKDWVFAYEVFEDGIIVRDMSHTSLLVE